MHSHSEFHNDVVDSKPEPRPDVHEFDDCGSNRLEPAPLPRRELIEVEFNKDARSGIETWDFDADREKPGHDFHRDWKPGLTKILENNNLVSWKPSFPLQHRWSRDCSKKSARESYIKAGRDKFVTFKFSPGADVLRIAKELRELPEIDHAVAVPHIKPPSQALASQALTEPYAGTSDQVVWIGGSAGRLTNQWYLFRCGVPEAWAQSAYGNGVVIADIDWGFDLSHPDLMHAELTKNMITNRPNVTDGNILWHGNGVLGLAGAALNREGMAGIAFQATLWAIQAGTGGIFRPEVNHEFWAEAISFVRSTPATGRKVIILELQAADFSNAEMIPSINKEIKEAIKEGIVVCVPAGNGNRYLDAGVDDDGTPIPETGSIVVGATKYHHEKNVRAGSNGGPRVTVYAPGDDECDLTCGLRRGYRDHFGGTSGATAKVAGVVALMLEKNNRLTPQDVRDILGRSQKPVVDENNNEVGVLLDANQAVREAIGMRSVAEGKFSAPRMERSEDQMQAA